MKEEFALGRVELEQLRKEHQRIAKMQAVASKPVVEIALDHSEMVHAFHVDNHQTVTTGIRYAMP